MGSSFSALYSRSPSHSQSSFWIPKYKYQLVEFLEARYKDVNWNKKGIKQLYAIYFNVMKKSNKLWLALVFMLIFNTSEAWAEKWRITAYCACKKCCGENAKGITASGKKVKAGMIALNWLPFGTKVYIDGLGVFTVEDRGAKSLFGSKKNHIKHIDVYMESHKEALKFGNQYRDVQIVRD